MDLFIVSLIVIFIVCASLLVWVSVVDCSHKKLTAKGWFIGPMGVCEKIEYD